MFIMWRIARGKRHNLQDNFSVFVFCFANIPQRLSVYGGKIVCIYFVFFPELRIYRTLHISTAFWLSTFGSKLSRCEMQIKAFAACFKMPYKQTRALWMGFDVELKFCITDKFTGRVRIRAKGSKAKERAMELSAMLFPIQRQPAFNAPVKM